ncbi:MAG: hypothetical protein JNJ83_00105 [Verrucomicrobiaceae bacterium]|nr:hypothetical protein [Verrucomicrobiaceae bacterium]
MRTSIAFIFCSVVAFAGPRASTSYNVATENADSGGRQTSSVSYTNAGSLGGITGISSVASPAETNKQGYISQLTEVTDLQLAASPPTVNEASTRQITVTATLDDDTTLDAMSSSVTWSVVSGPIVSISSSGLATVDHVYQNTAAVVKASYLGAEGSQGLMVLNISNDDLGSYANDGILDTWQVQYFGFNNPNATPEQDPDKDNISNLMEFATDLDPTQSSVLPVTAVKNGSNLEYYYTRSLAALAMGLNFEVQWSDTLLGTSWSTAGVGYTFLSNNSTAQQWKATIPLGTATRKFARLGISAP